MIELNVRFPSPDRFAIKFDDRETDALEFKAPVNDGDRADIRWYLESYVAQYITDVDDHSANRIAAQFGFSFAETRSVAANLTNTLLAKELQRSEKLMENLAETQQRIAATQEIPQQQFQAISQGFEQSTKNQARMIALLQAILTALSKRD